MTYDEYKSEREHGRICAGIDESAAVRLIDHLPRRFQAAHYFWSWVWMLSIPAFICISVFYKWWAGLLLLFIVTPMISAGIKKSAAQFALEHAEDDEQFFNLLVSHDLLVFKNVDA